MKRNLLKIYLIIIAILYGATETVYGQSQIPSCKSDPVIYSPQTSEMMRYDAVPVNMSTGRINLTIPLIDIQDKDFDFPIALSYSADGFKPTESDNFVGRNWSLRCGGVIYRQIRGIPDDVCQHRTFVNLMAESVSEYFIDGFMKLLDKGMFNMDEMRSNVSKSPYKYACTKDQFMPMPTIPNTDIESAPDMYYFNFGNHSGKFMINYDGTVSVAGYDGHHYEVDLSDYAMATNLYAHSTIIRIKTDDGYVYTFGGSSYGPVEYSAASWEERIPPTGYAPDHKHVITAWYLSEIKAPNGRMLTIHYKDIDEIYHRELSMLLGLDSMPETEWQNTAILYSLSGYATYESLEPLGFTPFPYELYARKPNSYYYNLNKIALIDYITVGSCRVDFHYSLKKQYTELHHVLPGFYRFRGAQLDSLSVSYDGKTCQTYSFGYAYKCANRLFLTSLKHAQRGTYQFNYNIPSSNVPPTTSAIDHWGYWTGRSDDGEIMPGTRCAGNIISNDFKVTTSNRDPSSVFCNATLLNTVVYPTGGKSVFEYQPHQYTSIIKQDTETFYDLSEQSVRDTNAGGARIWRIKFYDGISRTPIKETRYEYTDESGNQGTLTYMPQYRCTGFYLWNNNTLLGEMLENSNGIGRQFNPLQHILYPAVCEYYIDPIRGSDEANSPYKQTFFIIDPRSDDYTDFVYNTYTKSELQPYRYTLGRLDLELYFAKRFRWTGRSASFKNGKVWRELYYDNNHYARKIVDYQYEDSWKDDYSLCIYNESLLSGSNYGIYTHVNAEYFGMSLLGKKTVTEYDDNYHSIVRRDMYEYDDRGTLKKQIQLLPKGDSLVTSYQYLKQVPALVTDKLQKIHRQGYVSDVLSEHFNYRLQNGWNLGKPWYVVDDYYSGTDSQHLEKRATYPKYDLFGNPVHVEKDNTSCIYIWGYSGQYLVAKIENATYDEVTIALDGDTPEALSEVTDYSTVAIQIEKLRSRLPKAYISSYTYEPGIGMSSSTDPSEKTIFYEYDEKGRLSQTYRMGEGGTKEILQLNDYHIINE